MQLSSSPSFSAEKKGILRSKIHLFRNTVFALLSAASLSFAQDKPHTLADDVNFSTTSGEHVVLPSDPSPNSVWHQSLDADLSLKHIGTR